MRTEDVECSKAAFRKLQQFTCNKRGFRNHKPQLIFPMTCLAADNLRGEQPLSCEGVDTS